MKKLLAMLLVLTMLFTLVACGKETTEPTEAPTESTQVPTETPTAEPTEAPDADPMAYVENAVNVPSTTGDYDIPAILTVPEGEGPFPLVVMHHGYGGSKDENVGFIYIARRLAETGIASVRMDFAGCGESQEDFTNFCFSENVNNSFDCLNYALENANIDEEKLGIFGYSMGGALANIITCREDNPYSVRVMLAPAYNIGGDNFAEQQAIAEKDGYYANPWFGRELHNSAKYYEDVMDFAENREKIFDTTDIPTLVISGTEDTTVPYDETAELAEKLHAEFLSLDGVDHSYGFYSGADGYETMDTLATSVAGFYYTHLTDDNAETMFTGTPKEATYTENAVSIPSTTGDYDIPAIFTVPEGEGPFPMVMLHHGFGGSKEENIGFTYIARVLAEAGIASMRFDQPGCGESQEPYTTFSYSENINNSFDCLDYALANANIDKDNLGIIGYSMGGAAANIVTTREDNPYKVRVLIAPAYKLEGIYGNAAADLETAEKDGFAIVPNAFGPDDYHCGPQFYRDVIDYVENKEKVLETSEIPTLVITGTEDTTVPTDEVIDFATALHANYLRLDGIKHSYGFYDGNSKGYAAMDTLTTALTGFFYTHFTEDNANGMFGE